MKCVEDNADATELPLFSGSELQSFKIHKEIIQGKPLSMVL